MECRTDSRIDAEYFSKSAIAARQTTANLKTERLSQIAEVADGDHATFPDEPGGRVPYLQARDFDGFVSGVSEAYVSDAYFTKNKRSAIGPNTVLISIMGTVGRVGITPPDFVPCMANRAVGIIRPFPGTLASVLFAYLASRVSQDMILACSSGGVQRRINLDLLRGLPVPTFSQELQRGIDHCVRDGFKTRAAAVLHYEQAEAVLRGALGLARSDAPNPLTYARRASEVFSANRIDAEYFHPAKKAVLDQLRGGPNAPLIEHYQAIREMFDPCAGSGGELVRNFDLSDALQPVLDDSAPAMLASDVGSSKKRFAAGDVVISRLRSYLREIALVRTSPIVPAIGSSEFIVLRARPSEPMLTRAALLVFLRSYPVQTILKWSQDGSHHPRFGEEDLMSIPVPDAACAVAPRVEGLVEEMLNARARARRLLSQAKRVVEIAIEESEFAALKYLRES